MPRVCAIILAGSMKPSALRRAVAAPSICLPLGGDVSVLRAWIDALRDVAELDETRIVVNDGDEAAPCRHALGDLAGGTRPRATVIVEPASWRGAAGILRDVSDDLGDDDLVLAIEGSAFPATDLAVVAACVAGAPALGGVIAATADGRPSGVAAFRRPALRLTPDIGYFDLKEQLLPRLHERGGDVRVCEAAPWVWRGYDRASYLAAVQACRARGLGGPAISTGAAVHADAWTADALAIETDAIVEAGAVVYESVVMRGARVGAGAVVSRAVVGPGAVVDPDARITETILPGRRVAAAADPETALETTRAAG